MPIAKDIAEQIIACFRRGNQILIFGNGGSLADASHWAAEFHGIGPVIALNDPAKITSIANDFTFDIIFSKQVQDLAVPGDLIVGISSSGKSKNVNEALGIASDMGQPVIDWPRCEGTTAEVQQYQYKLLHDVYLLVRKAYS